MDIFGEHWRDHPDRIEAAWRAHVAASDLVLLPGDLSWAMRIEEVRVDLAWLAALPGRKLLGRGNHDYWWKSLAAVRRALPAGLEALDAGALRIGGAAVAATRGWLDPEEPAAGEADARIFAREVGRLRLALAALEALAGPDAVRVAMLHFMPFGPGGRLNDLSRQLAPAGIKLCIYGHLHGPDHGLRVEGEVEGVRYVCVSADLAGFAPIELLRLGGVS